MPRRSGFVVNALAQAVELSRNPRQQISRLNGGKLRQIPVGDLFGACRQQDDGYE